MLKTFILGSCLACAAVGCSDKMSGQTKTEAGNVKSAASALMAEETAHMGRITAAPDLGAVATEETQHFTMMGTSIDSMGGMMDGMSSCVKSMMGGDGGADGGMGMMVGFSDELALHKTNMAAATDLTAAQVEESRHQSMMQTLTTGVSSQMDTIMSSPCCSS